MPVEVSSRSLSPWAPEFRHIRFRGSIVRERFVLAHDPSLIDERDSAPLSEDEESFLRFLFKEAGLNLYHYRLGTLKRRIGACLRALHAGNFVDARRTVQQKPSLLPAAISTMVIGVTSFFRDGPLWETMRRSVIPDLFKG